MGKKNPRNGFWYWMTISKPANYFIAKSLGGDAEKEADAAMQDLGPALLVIIVIVLLVLLIIAFLG